MNSSRQVAIGQLLLTHRQVNNVQCLSLRFGWDDLFRRHPSAWCGRDNNGAAQSWSADNLSLKQSYEDQITVYDEADAAGHPDTHRRYYKLIICDGPVVAERNAGGTAVCGWRGATQAGPACGRLSAQRDSRRDRYCRGLV